MCIDLVVGVPATYKPHYLDAGVSCYLLYFSSEAQKKNSTRVTGTGWPTATAATYRQHGRASRECARPLALTTLTRRTTTTPYAVHAAVEEDVGGGGAVLGHHRAGQDRVDTCVQQRGQSD